MQLSKFVFSDEELTAIEHLAGCNYGPAEIALYLEIDKKRFLESYNILESQIRTAYDRGKLVTKFELMNKQRELGKGGNITSTQIFLKEQADIEIINSRNFCLFGDEY